MSDEQTWILFGLIGVVLYVQYNQSQERQQDDDWF